MNKVICNSHFLLGSASPRRLDLLNQIGINPDSVISPNIDEINLRKELPLDYVKRMAIEKNLNFSDLFSCFIVIFFFHESLLKGII